MPSTLSRWEARGRGRLCRRGSSSLQRIHPKWIRGTVAIWLKCRIRAEKEAFFIVPCDVPGLRGLWIVAVGDGWFFGPRFDYYWNQIWCCSVLLCKTFSRVFLRVRRLSFLRNGVVQAKRASKSTLFVASVLPRGALKGPTNPKITKKRPHLDLSYAIATENLPFDRASVVYVFKKKPEKSNGQSYCENTVFDGIFLNGPYKAKIP